MSPPGDLPDPGIKPLSPAAPALAGGFFTTEPSGKPQIYSYHSLNTIMENPFPMGFAYSDEI